MTQSAQSQLIADGNIGAFFQESVAAALVRQQLEATDTTIVYLVNLLCSFTRTEGLFEDTPDGPHLKPLALIYGEAAEARTAAIRYQALRRLGDVALFVAGVFSRSLQRRAVDVDYYVAMGGNAYGLLADSARLRAVSRVPPATWAELARRFVDFVDVLGEVAEQAQPTTDRDLMRLYEVWLRTGSRRAARNLRAAGIEPVSGSAMTVRH